MLTAPTTTPTSLQLLPQKRVGQRHARGLLLVRHAGVMPAFRVLEIPHVVAQLLHARDELSCVPWMHAVVARGRVHEGRRVVLAGPKVLVRRVRAKKGPLCR